MTGPTPAWLITSADDGEVAAAELVGDGTLAIKPATLRVGTWRAVADALADRFDVWRPGCYDDEFGNWWDGEINDAGEIRPYGTLARRGNGERTDVE